jgi:hypothetical protein
MKDPFQIGLSIEEVVNTPSKENGIDAATEFKLRVYGCELIQKAGLMLRLYPFVNHDNFRNLTNLYHKLQRLLHKCCFIDFIIEHPLRGTMLR